MIEKSFHAREYISFAFPFPHASSAALHKKLHEFRGAFYYSKLFAYCPGAILKKDLNARAKENTSENPTEVATTLIEYFLLLKNCAARFILYLCRYLPGEIFIASVNIFVK